MGTCSCAAGFDLVDCSNSKWLLNRSYDHKLTQFFCLLPAVTSGLSPEMIVLIVMGALVVLSAVIGFVAWAYMRRKRGYEEIQ